LQPLSFTFETFVKKLAKAKIVDRVSVKKIKAKKYKKIKKDFEIACKDDDFTKTCQKW
jgi:hypothetical protein